MTAFPAPTMTLLKKEYSNELF